MRLKGNVLSTSSSCASLRFIDYIEIKRYMLQRWLLKKMSINSVLFLFLFTRIHISSLFLESPGAITQADDGERERILKILLRWGVKWDDEMSPPVPLKMHEGGGVLESLSLSLTGSLLHLSLLRVSLSLIASYPFGWVVSIITFDKFKISIDNFPSLPFPFGQRKHSMLWQLLWMSSCTCKCFHFHYQTIFRQAIGAYWEEYHLRILFEKVLVFCWRLNPGGMIVFCMTLCCQNANKFSLSHNIRFVDSENARQTLSSSGVPDSWLEYTGYPKSLDPSGYLKAMKDLSRRYLWNVIFAEM